MYERKSPFGVLLAIRLPCGNIRTYQVHVRCSKVCDGGYLGLVADRVCRDGESSVRCKIKYFLLWVSGRWGVLRWWVISEDVRSKSFFYQTDGGWELEWAAVEIKSSSGDYPGKKMGSVMQGGRWLFYEASWSNMAYTIWCWCVILLIVCIYGYDRGRMFVIAG